MKENCRLAWEAPTGAPGGHGITGWVTRDKAQSYVDAMRKDEEDYPVNERLIYHVETKRLRHVGLGPK